MEMSVTGLLFDPHKNKNKKQDVPWEVMGIKPSKSSNGSSQYAVQMCNCCFFVFFSQSLHC